VSLHIDVIENDWLAGQQRVVASLTFVDGVPDLRSLDLPKWASVVGLEQLPNPVRPDQEEDLLQKISARLQGDYLFATPPHEARECDYPQVASLQSPKAPTHQHKARRAAAV
jgi:hypothetical protein